MNHRPIEVNVNNRVIISPGYTTTHRNPFVNLPLHLAATNIPIVAYS